MIVVIITVVELEVYSLELGYPERCHNHFFYFFLLCLVALLFIDFHLKEIVVVLISQEY